MTNHAEDGADNRRALHGLFPQCPGLRSWETGWAGMLVLVALLPALTALSLVRQVGAPAVATIWAEDGAVFLADSLREPLLRPVLDPYAGYVHVWPRLAAEATTLLPVRYAAAALASTAAFLTGVVTVTVYLMSAGHLRSRLTRAVLAALVVLAPHGGWETANNVANSHWYLTIGVFWVLIGPVRRWVSVVLVAAVVVLAAASSPLAVLFAPLAVCRLFATRDARSLTVVGAYAVGAATQVATVTSTSRAWTGTSPSLQDLVESYSARVVLGAVVGVERAAGLFEDHGYASVVAAATSLSAVACLVVLAGASQRWLLCVSLVVSVGMFVVTATVNWTPAFDPDVVGAVAMSTGPRYLIVPIVLLYAAVAAAVDGAPRRYGVPVGLACTVAVAFAVVADFRVEIPFRSDGPVWSAEVTRAAQECYAAGNSNDVVQVPSSPQGWSVVVPCSRVTQLPLDGGAGFKRMPSATAATASRSTGCRWPTGRHQPGRPSPATGTTP